MKLSGGIIPVMLVAYDKNGKIDLGAQAALLDWYEKRGVHGLFSLCQSTEVYWLDDGERKAIAELVYNKLGGKMPVVSSGITSQDIDEQIEQAKRIYSYGSDAMVFMRNGLGETEDDFLRNLEKVCKELPEDMDLGIYECPYPRWQHLTDREFEALVKTDRFRFIKDTVCDVDVMRRRHEINQKHGGKVGLYNANCATFLDTLRFGYDGFSGVMANFHPELYVWMYEHKDDVRADIIDKYAGLMSVIETRSYPICCKRYLAKYEGLPITDLCRSKKDETKPAVMKELDDLYELTLIARDVAEIKI